MNIKKVNSLKNYPDFNGRFGEFGGRFVSEKLKTLILEVEKAYNEANQDILFENKLNSILSEIV